MVAKEAIDAALRAYGNHWRAWANVAPNGALSETDEIIAAATGVPGPFLNRVIVFGVPERADEALADAIGVMEEKAVPFIVEVFPGADAMIEVAERAGFSETKGGPFMVHPDIASVFIDAPDGIAIRRVANAAELDEWAIALAGGFGGPVDFTRMMAWPGVIDNDEMDAFVGYCDGAPIATSLANFEGDATGIYNVSTVEAMRRRGVGTALTAMALHAGARVGGRIAYLQSSDLGIGVYTKMGFEPVLKSTVFFRPTAAA